MENRRIIHTMATVSAMHRYYVSRAASAAGLYFGQPPLLEYVTEHGGCTQNELCDRMHVSAPSVAVSVKRLEKSGLLTKKPDTADMRRNMLYITEEGKKALLRFHEECKAVDEKLFDGFSEDDREAFYNILLRLSHNLGADELKPYELRKLFAEEQHSKADKE